MHISTKALDQQNRYKFVIKGQLRQEPFLERTIHFSSIVQFIYFCNNYIKSENNHDIFVQRKTGETNSANIIFLNAYTFRLPTSLRRNFKRSWCLNRQLPCHANTAGSLVTPSPRGEGGGFYSGILVTGMCEWGQIVDPKSPIRLN